MKRSLALVLAQLLIAGISPTPLTSAAPIVKTPQSPQVVPVQEEPRHHLVFANGAAYVLDVQIEPGDTTLFHTHSHPILYVAIGASRIRTQALEGEWTRAPALTAMPEGTVASVVRYAEMPATHRVDNVGDGLFRLIAVVNREPGARRGLAGRTSAAVAGAQTPPPAGADGAAEIDNPWFRAYRFTLDPGASTGKHRHATPVVIVQVGEGSSVVNAPQGAIAETSAPGAWSYHTAGEEHELRNIGEAPVQLIEVEVR